MLIWFGRRLFVVFAVLGGLLGLMTGAAVAEDLLQPCRERLELLERQGHATQTFLATLPDPVDSRFARELDLFIGSIRQAMERLDYSEDRHCLPWKLSEQQAKAETRDAKTRHRRRPGALLFRKPGEVRVVLLVGETPAWGVHQKALHTALDEYCRGLRPLGGTAKMQPVKTIRVLGPTFSGSLASLAAGLQTWRQTSQVLNGQPQDETWGCKGSLDLQVVSGTANLRDNEARLRRDLSCPEEPEIDSLEDLVESLQASTPLEQEMHFPCADFAKVSYESMLTDHEALLEYLFEEVVRKRLNIHDAEAVALLVESSHYGNAFEQLEDGDWKKKFLLLRFPMHISQLRRAHDEKTRRQTQENDPGYEEEPSIRLELGIELPAQDGVTTYSPRQTSQTQNLVLANLLQLIARHRIQAVVIVATNTLDKLFLAEELRRHAPDVRLLTFDADVLLAHSSFSTATLGMILASSNPLTAPGPLQALNPTPSF